MVLFRYGESLTHRNYRSSSKHKTVDGKQSPGEGYVHQGHQPK